MRLSAESRYDCLTDVSAHEYQRVMLDRNFSSAYALAMTKERPQSSHPSFVRRSKTQMRIAEA